MTHHELKWFYFVAVFAIQQVNTTAKGLGVEGDFSLFDVRVILLWD